MQRFYKQLIVLLVKKAKKMKKLAFVFAAVVAVSFASCGNKAQQAETETVEEATENCCEKNDSCCGDSLSCSETAVEEAPAAE